MLQSFWQKKQVIQTSALVKSYVNFHKKVKIVHFEDIPIKKIGTKDLPFGVNQKTFTPLASHFNKIGMYFSS